MNGCGIASLQVLLWRAATSLNTFNIMAIQTKFFMRRVFVSGLLCTGALAWAQKTTLYDPQPPANSAYIRVIVGDQDVEVALDKRTRLEKVPAGTPSAYLVVPAGQHEVTLKTKGKSLSVPVKAESSRSITVLISSLTGGGSKTVVIEDKINSNRLKAIIAIYNLTPGTAVDAWTADGNTAIFQGVTSGATASLVVNPVKLAYMVTGAGNKTALANHEFSMTAGNAYSIVVTGSGTPLTTQAFQNTVERYQGH